MHKDADLSVETAEYYFQCWLRKEEKESSREEFAQKEEVLKKQFSEKYNYYIRLVEVTYNDKLEFRWSRSHKPRRCISAVEELFQWQMNGQSIPDQQSKRLLDDFCPLKPCKYDYKNQTICRLQECGQIYNRLKK